MNNHIFYTNYEKKVCILKVWNDLQIHHLVFVMTRFHKKMEQNEYSNVSTILYSKNSNYKLLI